MNETPAPEPITANDIITVNGVRYLRIDGNVNEDAVRYAVRRLNTIEAVRKTAHVHPIHAAWAIGAANDEPWPHI